MTHGDSKGKDCNTGWKRYLFDRIHVLFGRINIFSAGKPSLVFYMFAKSWYHMTYEYGLTHRMPGNRNPTVALFLAWKKNEVCRNEPDFPTAILTIRETWHPDPAGGFFGCHHACDRMFDAAPGRGDPGATAEGAGENHF
jgi:hypothetical protein